MKTFKTFIGIASMFVIVCLFSSCEQKITTTSIVHPDGSVDRTITFTEVDSVKAHQNVFGLQPGNGWESEIEYLQPEAETKTSKQKISVTFRKRFASIDEMNNELDAPRDTLFRINSAMEKKFRWFYTYLNYTDTYRTINRFKHVSKEDYFTPEDFTFINRMPAEGKSITKADSIYLERLTDKLGDFFMLALYEEHVDIMLQAMHKNNLDRRWMDSIQHHKGYLFSMFSREENDKLLEETFMLQLIDSLNNGFPVTVVAEDYKALYSRIKPRIKFMTEVATEGKFSHIIKMPWKVVSTNADSVNGTSLYWRPLTLKFMLNDYTMHAESRKMNYWAVILSGLFILGTAALFWRGRRKPVERQGHLDPPLP